MKLPQLSLRDLFWLVALMAMGCGWWLDHQGLVASYKALQEFYETPIEFDAPLPPEEPDSVAVKVVDEPLMMESEFHQKQIAGQPIQ